ncbi:uncharacterized protein EV154DRAFT_556426 [Mucor mucedo]|uniref:uncharacterized protein n=1 Tax=Mucor mucedo TaxID=29922 RepID=UPI00221EE2D0|nr:uncharacterized protein EV154DRAFT_556426 [Mucor mucedo]KAI7873081.1 hypothetical protein EV154DRAFT_556426 [Mucor mucedo]
MRGPKTKIGPLGGNVCPGSCAWITLVTDYLRTVPLLPDNRVRFFLCPPFDTGITRLDYGTYEHHNKKKNGSETHSRAMNPICFLHRMSSVQLNTPEVLFDIDSYIYVPSTLSIPFHKTNFDIYYRPNYNYTIKKDLGINYHYDDTRLGSGKVSQCPNVLLAKAGDNFVNIFFPALCQHYGKSGFSVKLEHQCMFVDNVLIPAVQAVMDIDCLAAPLDFKSAATSGIGHAAFKLVTVDLNQVLTVMKRLC